MCGWRLLPQALPAESTALEPKIVRSRMKPSCGRRFGQGDVEPEFTKLAGEARGEAGAVASLEVVGAEVLVGDAAAEHPVDGGQDRGRDGHDGLAWPAPRPEAPEERPQVGVLRPGGAPGDLHQQRLQPRVARAEPGRAALARALVVARAQAGPGDEVGGRDRKSVVRERGEG